MNKSQTAKRQIRILYTIPNFDTAGSGKVVYDLVRGLMDRHLVEIACSHNRGLFFKEVEKLGLPIHIRPTTLPYHPYVTLLFRLQPLIRFFRKGRYDVIHSFHWSSDWTEALAARLSGAKWIYSKKAMNWGNWHWKIKCWLASCVVIVNEDMRKFFPSKKNQQFIPFGLDTGHYQESQRQSNHGNKFILITVANLVPIKGIEVILQALALLERPDLQFVIVGDDSTPYAQQLKRDCEQLHIQDQVLFRGKLLDVRTEVTRADVFILATHEPGEGMPMALVEAMSMGIPVLGSNVPGIRQVLKDFPQFLFQPGDSKSLVQGIRAIIQLDETQRLQVGTQLREYCIQNFSYATFIKRHEELYESLVE